MKYDYEIGQKYTNPDGLTMTVTHVTDLQITYEYEENGEKDIGVLNRCVADNWRNEGIMTLPHEKNVAHFSLTLTEH